MIRMATPADASTVITEVSGTPRMPMTETTRMTLKSTAMALVRNLATVGSAFFMSLPLRIPRITHLTIILPMIRTNAAPRSLKARDVAKGIRVERSCSICFLLVD